jgi:hypothetical protein
MLLLIHWNWLIAEIGIVITLVAFILLGIRNYANLTLLRESSFAAEYLGSELKKKEKELEVKEDELEHLFIHLLQWRNITSDYRRILHELRSIAETGPLKETVANLEAQYARLFEQLENNRVQFMEKIRASPDYEEQVKVVMDEIGKALMGMKVGMKADETPLLNDNREN